MQSALIAGLKLIVLTASAVGTVDGVAHGGPWFLNIGKQIALIVLLRSAPGIQKSISPRNLDLYWCLCLFLLTCVIIACRDPNPGSWSSMCMLTELACQHAGNHKGGWLQGGCKEPGLGISL